MSTPTTRLCGRPRASASDSSPAPQPTSSTKANANSRLRASSRSVSGGHDQHGHRAQLAHDRSSFERRRAAGDGVLDDGNPVPRLQCTSEASGDAVVLGLLADAEAADLSTLGGRHGGDAETDGVGTRGEPADGGDVVG
jgi:hypothetical protein